MTFKTVIFTLLFLNFGFLLKAQETKEFMPQGTAFGKIFMNYNSEFGGDEVQSEFVVNRGYFGYKYNMSPEFTATVMIDIGKASVTGGKLQLDTNSYDIAINNKLSQYTAFLKTAALNYSKGNLSVAAGMIGLKQHKLSEKYWKHRYIEKSYQDAWGFSSSADLGIIAAYKIHQIFSVDLTIRNGEGYKKLQSDNKFLTGFGYTISPVKGLQFRGYYDMLKKDNTQFTYSHFIGYKNKSLSVGFEYSAQNNHSDSKGATVGGISTFASYNVTDKIQLFGRYDSFSNETDISEDASLYFAGIEYSPIKNVQMALNYRGKNFNKSDDNDINALYLNLQLAF